MSEVIVYSGNMTHVTAIDARGPVLLKTATGEDGEEGEAADETHAAPTLVEVGAGS